MAYKAQYYPGKTSVALNRKKVMDPAYKLEKLRSLSDDDVVIMLGHRAPGSAYKTIHPPLKEGGEPDDPIRKIVEPTAGPQQATGSGTVSSLTPCSTAHPYHTSGHGWPRPGTGE